MRFSIRVNNDLPLPAYVALARAAERAGFDQLWVSDDLFFRSAPVILAAVAAVTERLEIGTGILNPYTVHPSEIAMLAATLDELSGGRFNLGLAAGAADFLRWVGLPQPGPLTAVRESILAIRALLDGERAACDGAFLRWTSDAYLRFRAPRRTPIYVGAMSPRMLGLAGELADGALPLLLPPEHYFTVRPLLEAGLRRRAPGLGALDAAACIWVSLDEDLMAARRALAEKVAYYGHAMSPLILERLGLRPGDFDAVTRAMIGERDVERACGLVDERMLRIGVVGGPADVIARLEPLVEAGARHLSFGPPLGPDPRRAIELLGRHVIPHFRPRPPA
jgi:5,10-methylenetetrahydromethanopterin reductase